MQNEWLEYKETRRELKQRRPRVVLSAEGTLRFNKRALDLLGNPAGIRLLFDVKKSCIGVRAEDPEIEYALPLRIEKLSALVHIKSFCNKYGIRIGSTLEFAEVQVDGDGVLLLDLTKARRLA